VIDTLNIPMQMKNQIQAFGKPSEMIKDYVERKLIPIPQTEAAQRLWVIIDPWTYRDKITIPKMIVNGANDPYWPLDALNSYWDGLKGDKWLLYVPNAGHDLIERNKDGKPEALPKRAMNTVAAFCRSHTFDKAMPKLDYAILSPPMVKGMDVSLLSNTKPLVAWMLSASSPTRDFRKSWWEQKPLDILGKDTGFKLDLPKNGYEAALIDLEFELEGLKYNLSTPLRILEPAK